MNFRVLGSGGCTLIPRPGCTCSICQEAREKGIPYARTGPSLFLEDSNVLFDTPEESAHQLNRENIQTIDYIFYSHWHPDHTLGMRIMEQMNLNFLAWFFEEKLPSKKINVCALPEVMNDLKAIKNKNGSYFEYYSEMGLMAPVYLEEGVPFVIGDIEVTSIPVKHGGFVSTVFVIKQKDKKVGYAPCDTKPFPKGEVLQDLDVLLIGDILPARQLKGYTIPEDTGGHTKKILDIIRDEAYTMDELIEIITTYNVGRTIVTHIEEEWGKSFDDYKEIEEAYREYHIEFSFDGMRIHV